MGRLPSSLERTFWGGHHSGDLRFALAITLGMTLAIAPPPCTLSLAIHTDGYVHIAIGPSPSFTGCAAGWQSTGNLIGNGDAGRYDYSQFGGSPFTTYSGAPAAVLAGTVVEVFVVVDGSWNAAATGGDSEQTVLVDNIDVNGELYTFDAVTPITKDECKKDGWMELTRLDFSEFKNQGDCIQYFNTDK